ncbi:BC1872 family protein [Alicyclobacillus macrosporangiidus]|uniref:BC1872 family protein n=1 Tax=Alicyclobacillus macrosporangiidus TaxID=392015 RepID=UPI000943679E|nr:hypothetical protein [Alicyclobacillus macrosporangiidus]
MKRWSEMTPRERDALVAEQVFGWTGCWANPHGLAAFGVPPGKTSRRGIGYYTTDISTAWQIIEHVKSKGFYIDVLSYADGYVAVTHDGQEPLNLDGTAPTASEAICIAALKAVGVNVE